LILRGNVRDHAQRIAANSLDKQCSSCQVLVEITVVIPSGKLTVEQESAIKQIVWHSKKTE
jgi:hypothetical protein